MKEAIEFHDTLTRSDIKENLLSVVVTVYNVLPYLKDCVDSILGQSYRNLELILVDDGATDGSGELCDEIAEKDFRVRVIHQKNAGAAVAKNTGIQAAQGSYLGIVDGDDWIAPEMYQEMIDKMTDEKTDLVICGYRYVSSKKTVDYLPGGEIICRRDAFRRLFSEEDVLFISPCNKLYSKALYEHLIYPEGKHYEDEFITHCLLYQVDKIATVNEAFYNYRQREESLTHKEFTIYNFDQIEAYFERYRFLDNKNMIQWIPSSCERFSDFYIEARKQFKPHSLKEIHRMKQMDAYAKTIIREQRSNCSWRVCLRLLVPSLYCKMGLIKDIFRRNRIGNRN